MQEQSAEKGNKGEKTEISTKKLLFANKENTEFLVEIFGEEASAGIEIINPDTTTPYASQDQIKKAKATSKADIIIKFKATANIRYCSMKSLTGAKPAILNHTPRSAKAFQTTLQHCITDVDLLAKEYIEKRTKKDIGEDIAFYKLELSHDKKIKTSFAEMLAYFTFTGTGARLSPNECDSVLIIYKDTTLKFIDCNSKEQKMNYINSIIDKCVISFRKKGMPKQIGTNCEPWIYTNELTGAKCGSIHVRASL